MRRLGRAVTLGFATLTPCLLPAAAIAHPLGNFTVNVYSGLQLRSEEVRIEYVVDMAEIPTFQELPVIDTDGDDVASDQEKQAWADRMAPQFVSNLSLSVGGDAVTLRVVSSSMRFRPGQGGLQILRFEGTFVGAVTSSGTIEYRDRNYAGVTGWREITAIGEDGVALEDSSVPARSVSNALLSYPQDLLSSPLNVSEAIVSFGPGVSVDLGDGSSEPAGSARPGVTGGAFADLVARTGLSAPIVALSILLAMGFGALHALGPGHGKTLMAAYLVGAGGRVRQAVAVGAAVSVMHTASVLGLGLLVLSAQRLFPAQRVYPWLGLLSGLVALGLGASLLVVRLGAWGNARSPRAHDDERGHDHEDGSHSYLHVIPAGPVLSRKGLLALAFAGGVLPSPTALVVLLASVALHRLAFGLALIVAFSIGLAAALIAVGVLALRARDIVSRRMSSRIGRLVPVLSASAIMVVGLVLTVRGIVQL